MWLLRELWKDFLSELDKFRGRDLTETARRRPTEAGFTFRDLLAPIGYAVGGPVGGMIGGVLGGSFGGGGYKAPPPSYGQKAAQRVLSSPIQGQAGLDTIGAYTGALQEMIQGQGPYYQAALAKGIGNINVQAAQGQQQIQSTMGQRGLLSSGMTQTGLQSLEQGRLGAISALHGQIEKERMRRQEFGMTQVTAQQQILNAARQVGISEQQIAYAQQQNDYNALAEMIQYAYMAMNPPQQQQGNYFGGLGYNLPTMDYPKGQFGATQPNLPLSGYNILSNPY